MQSGCKSVDANELQHCIPHMLTLWVPYVLKMPHPLLPALNGDSFKFMNKEMRELYAFVGILSDNYSCCHIVDTGMR